MNKIEAVKLKRYISSGKTTDSPGSMNGQSEQVLEELEALTLDLLYQTWENYPEYGEADAYEVTLDHVILVITEMDDDGIYESLLPFADYDNKEFCSFVRSIVDDHYYDYEWYDIN